MAVEGLQEALAFLAETAAPEPKDAWDKAQIIGVISSGLVVALVGAAFTWLYGRQQRAVEEHRRIEDAAAAREREAAQRQSDEERARVEAEARSREERLNESGLIVQRVQTVQSLLPDLRSAVERDRRAALLAVQAMGDTRFAAHLARIYGGAAGVSALVNMSLSSNLETESENAATLLTGLTRRLRYSVALVMTGHPPTYGCGFCIAPGLILTTIQVSHGPEGRLRIGAQEVAWNLMASSEDHHLAVLSSPEAPLIPLTIAPRAPQIDDDILVVGWDGYKDEWAAHAGVVLGNAFREPGGSRWVLPAEIGSVPGFSGAPVVNSALEVVGIHYRKYRETNDEQKRGLATELALETIKSFLTANNLDTGKPTAEEGPAEQESG